MAPSDSVILAILLAITAADRKRKRYSPRGTIDKNRKTHVSKAVRAMCTAYVGHTCVFVVDLLVRQQIVVNKVRSSGIEEGAYPV